MGPPLAFHQGISTPLLDPILNSITKEPIFFFLKNKTSSAIGNLQSRLSPISLWFLCRRVKQGLRNDAMGFFGLGFYLEG